MPEREPQMTDETHNGKAGQSLRVIERRDGVTSAERYLKRLAERSFLSLWSHAGVFRDQGRGIAGGDGKEVADLLVVFDRHIIIFSDKDCKFPDSGNLEVDWSRWFRRAVMESAKQVWGAERWIKDFPTRLYLDRACTQKFPIPLPDPSVAIFHRIVVAHDASRRCREVLGGTGSLIIAPLMIGAMHTAKWEDGGRPFTVGRLDPARGFVHVLDDTSLDVLLGTLDTITDFVDYLSKKETFVESGNLISAAGEDDLLAYYLRNLNRDGQHDFLVPDGIRGVVVAEGCWADFASSPQRHAQIEANRVSYAWDRLIETFSGHILKDTQYYATKRGIEHGERIMRFLASEPRTRRRLLAKMLVGIIETTPDTMRRTLVVEPSHPGDPHYVFLLVPRRWGTYEEYRELRRHFLYACCAVTRLEHPDAEDIVGIATETSMTPADSRSEDAVYFDARDWSPEHEAEARSLQQDLGLLTNVKLRAGTEHEYPSPSRSHGTSINLPQAPRMKGWNRNSPCPCGSGKKFKKCCGA